MKEGRYMPISDDYENKLNRMNRASQNVNLGTILKQADNVINSGSPIARIDSRKVKIKIIE